MTLETVAAVGGIVVSLLTAGGVAWRGGVMAQKIDDLRKDVDNDKHGRAAFQEVRTDVAVMKRDIEYIKAALDRAHMGD